MNNLQTSVHKIHIYKEKNALTKIRVQIYMYHEVKYY